jgi:hypothetical protein
MAKGKKGTDPPKKNPIKFECGFAPGGCSNTVLKHRYEGKDYTYNISMENKIYILPSGLSKEETKRYRKALMDNNFIDVTVNTGVKFDPETGDYIYKAMHPEHTERNRINATMGLSLYEDGKPVLDDKGIQKSKQISIVDGLVVTSDKMVYEALIKAGFLHAGRIEGGKNAK